MKERAVPMIIEYVPVSHIPETLEECRKIKHDSRLKAGMLLTMRWIKPVHRHASGQQTANLIMHLQTIEAANHMIREGIVIAGKRSWARHMCGGGGGVVATS